MTRDVVDEVALRVLRAEVTALRAQLAALASERTRLAEQLAACGLAALDPAKVEMVTPDHPMYSASLGDVRRGLATVEMERDRLGDGRCVRTGDNPCFHPESRCGCASCAWALQLERARHAVATARSEGWRAGVDDAVKVCDGRVAELEVIREGITLVDADNAALLAISNVNVVAVRLRSLTETKGKEP